MAAWNALHKVASRCQSIASRQDNLNKSPVEGPHINFTGAPLQKAQMLCCAPSDHPSLTGCAIEMRPMLRRSVTAR
ncbi:hypothetical protein IG631_03250 [Alternaria alternata]|nr:hypothetical protein IG631_03250 [Alternaria alternata]